MPIYHVETDVDNFHGSQLWELVADSPEHAFELFNKSEGEIVCEELEVMGHVDVSVKDFYEVDETAIEEEPVRHRDFPMLDGPMIPTELAEIIFEKYHSKFPSQTLESIKRRGGFGWAEIPIIFKDA